MNVHKAHAELRRNHILTDANPRSKLDYVITVRRTLVPIRVQEAPTEKAIMSLRYVPDREILSAKNNLQDYIQAVREEEWENMAMLSASLLDDLTNALVPRWIELHLDMTGLGQIYMQDRQPKWDNRPLLDRLERW